MIWNRRSANTETKHKWFSQDFLPLPADRNISGTARPLMRYPGLWILREYGTTSCRIHDGRDTSHLEFKEAAEVHCILKTMLSAPKQEKASWVPQGQSLNVNVDVESWKLIIFIPSYVLGCNGSSVWSLQVLFISS